MRLDTALSTIFQLVVLGTDCIGSCKSNYSRRLLLKRTDGDEILFFNSYNVNASISYNNVCQTGSEHRHSNRHFQFQD